VARWFEPATVGRAVRADEWRVTCFVALVVGILVIIVALSTPADLNFSEKPSSTSKLDQIQA